MTRAEAEAHQAKLLVGTGSGTGSGSGSVANNVTVVDDELVPENVNRLLVDGLEARSVDEAIKLLRYTVT